MALAFVAGPAVADTHEEVIAKVPFRFVAAGRLQDAGAYGLKVDMNEGTVELVPPRGPGEVMLVVTRLAPPAGQHPEGRLVFDKVGKTYTLSEVWIPGVDGFLVHAANETHPRETTTLARKAS
jgi:hypothetical protein